MPPTVVYMHGLMLKDPIPLAEIRNDSNRNENRHSVVHCEYLPATEIMTMIIKDHARAVDLSHVADFKRKRLRVSGL